MKRFPQLSEWRDKICSQASETWANASPHFLTARQWVKRWRRAIGSCFLAVLLLSFLLRGGIPWYVKNHEALSPLLTLLAGIAVAAVALMRHFAQTDADRQRRITESFSTAGEQLGSDKLEVRLGGLYSLERISKESDDDYWTVMENLTAFVRERSRRVWAEMPLHNAEKSIRQRAHLLWERAGQPEGRDEEFWEQASEEEKRGRPPEADIAAALTVIKRRSAENQKREEANDWRLDFSGAALSGAYFGGVNLKGADVSRAHLEWADLTGAHLKYADLSGGHLEWTNLRKAHLEGAILPGAHLEGANLIGAHLEGADLSSSTGVSQPQIDEAFGDGSTQLPEGVIRPAHWLDGSLPEVRGLEAGEGEP